MLKPRALKKGDIVGLTAPASPTALDNVEKAVKRLEEFGLKVKVGKTCTSTYGYLSGTDELRFTEINEMFGDSTLAGIVCLRGGYGTPRLLDKIDYSIIAKNPKIFVGFSDTTGIHGAIQNATGLVTFHGPMGAMMGGDYSEYSLSHWVAMLFGEQGAGPMINPDGEQMIGMYGGKAKGKLCGGNLSLIADLMGTPYEIQTEGKLLFIEEVGEAPYQIDRMLTQLRLAGKLDHCAGIVLGDFANCESDKKRDETLSLEEVLGDILPKNKPTIANVRAGHCDPNMILPLHVEYEIDGDTGTLTLLEKPTE
ncbi:MAG: LD-carboxypeptidase [Negativicutes bacterium]|nr:LD-carboxypeptidase [Negativicutes bacterium]